MIQVKHDHTVFDLILTLFPERVLAIEKIINSKMTEFELGQQEKGDQPRKPSTVFYVRARALFNLESSS